MAVEIERKFLVRDISVVTGLAGERMVQGYIDPNGLELRVRLSAGGGALLLRASGDSLESVDAQYPIAASEARELLEHHAVAVGAVEDPVHGRCVVGKVAPQLTHRIRMGTRGSWLTLKARGDGLSRPEFECRVPASDARVLLAHHCNLGALIKTRYRVPFVPGRFFEVDVFEGALTGLVTVELELQHADETFTLPSWIGAEVTHDGRYSNARLAATLKVPS